VRNLKKKPTKPVQQDLFKSPPKRSRRRKFISTYRVALVRDQKVAFEQCRLMNSQQCAPLVRKLIETHGQSDREQLCVLLLNAQNEIIGLNIVATGNLTSTQVHASQVLKPAILANSCALILAHNHPSGNPSASPSDLALTKNLIQAARIMGIQVHEHIIVSMCDDRYYSFADNGLIQEAYSARG
jgi:DNA repair protein RadC